MSFVGLHNAMTHDLILPIFGKNTMSQSRKLLFVCSQNKLRSPTAERVFSQ